MAPEKTPHKGFREPPVHRYAIRRQVAVAAIAIAGVLVFFFYANWRTGAGTKNSSQTAQYVGGKACAGCHAREYEAWRGSHHDLAMQEANEKSVLGDFTDAKFNYDGIASTFFKRDNKFFVNTDGPDGKLADYEISYTFGVAPLQQYLIKLSGGRLQALSIAWDSRPKRRGGQRWFHLYPNERLRAGDSLHWTGIEQNWNHQCAECHSTNLRKRYDASQGVYATTWSEINVSCEACHGPGSTHTDWAEKNPGKKTAAANNELAVQFIERRGMAWRMEDSRGIARRSAARATSVEIDACARCHSRRGVLTEDYVHGKSLLDSHLPALLSDGLYYPDGQIRGEVYEYGSFMQSKMQAAGVTCSDCHEPHSLKLRAEGNAVCAQCHAPARFAAAEHHHHKPGETGSSCIGCHMPERHYMVVDSRRDHSFRVPRPDLSEKLGTPNACNGCHADKNTAWAAANFAKWYPPSGSVVQRYAETLHQARIGSPQAENKLAALAKDAAAPAIARATGLAELRGSLSRESWLAVRDNLRDRDPLIRLGALRALEGMDAKTHVAETAPLLQDPVRAIRISAAELLAGSRDSFAPAERAALDTAIKEYMTAQTINGDRAEAHLNLGILYSRSREFDKAENEYRLALKRQPGFAPAYVNLAELYRSLGRDRDGEKLLREAVKSLPDNASINHTLGLLMVREKKLGEALPWLQRAAESAPENSRYAYVYGVALNSSGRPKEAIAVLAAAHQRHTGDRDLLYALATMNRDAGSLYLARMYMEKLVALAPGDPAVLELREQLRR